jgi:outer membrane protein TolC
MKLPESVLLLAMALAAPLPAQDDAAAPPGEDPEPQAVQTLELTLVQAARFALHNNLGVRLQDLAAEQAAYDYRGSWGDFEWDFTSTLSYADSERPVSSSFLSGADVVKETRESLSLDFNRPLTTGGSFNVHFNTDTDETNSVIFNSDRLTSDLLTISYTQPLRRGAWSRYATSQQRENEVVWQLEIERQRASRQTLIYDVAVAYWELVLAIEQRDVSASSLDLGLELLDKRQKELDAGVGTEVEVLQARAEVATRIETLLQNQNDVNQRMDVLKELLFDAKDEETWEQEIVPVTPLPEAEDVDVGDVPPWSQALLTGTEMRTELRQHRLQIDVARLRHQRTMSERLAGLDLDLSASSGQVDEKPGDALSDTLSWDFPRWTVALTYNMPIGNKRADYAERRARTGVRSAVVEHDRQELTIISDVRMAVRDVAYRAEAVRAAEQSLALAERQHEAEQLRLDEGLSTNIEVLEFQQDLIEAMSSQRRARAEYAKSRVALSMAQGIIDQEPQP